MLKAKGFLPLLTIRRHSIKFVTQFYDFYFFKRSIFAITKFISIKMIDSLPKNKKIILFDGVCNLCNGSVIEVIKHDKNDNFRFVSLQSDLGKEICNYLKIDTSKTDSIILFEPTVAYYTKSTAALIIMNSFGGFWKTTQLFYVFPEFFRNWVYDFIAKNRYKWFGKKESCMIPTQELTAKFLDS